MKTIFYTKSLAFASLTAIVLLSACGGDSKNSAPAAPAATQVTVEPVKFTNAAYNDEYPATVTALNQIELRPQVSGFITGIHFQDGQRVRKGQLLYAIDNQLYAANYDQAVANLQVQQANLNKAQASLKG